MENFADRTINELIESYPLFLDALKEEHDVLMNIIDIIFSSCSIITKTEKIRWARCVIECEVFDCFFEYQIYKIMEKYRYYKNIKHQAHIVRQIFLNREYLGLKTNCDPKKIDLMYLNVIYHRNDRTIGIGFDRTHYYIKVEDKYHQDMINLINEAEKQ